MMIDKFVDIEGGVDVQNICIVNFAVYRDVRWEPGKEMCPTNDRVDMDDAHLARALAGSLRLYYPKAGAGIWLVICRIPMYERTRVINATIREPEE